MIVYFAYKEIEVEFNLMCSQAAFAATKAHGP